MDSLLGVVATSAAAVGDAGVCASCLWLVVSAIGMCLDTDWEGILTCEEKRERTQVLVNIQIEVHFNVIVFRTANECEKCEKRVRVRKQSTRTLGMRNSLLLGASPWPASMI